MNTIFLTAQTGKWDNNTGEIKGTKVLVYNKAWEGFFIHKNIQASTDALKKLADDHQFHIDVSDDPVVFTDDNLKQYHAVIFCNTNDKAFATDAQRLAMMRYVQAGGGFVGIHSASTTESGWEWFRKLVGAVFWRHPPSQKYQVKVFDDKHPSTHNLPEVWDVKDECYFLKNINPAIRVLLVHDLTTVDDEKGLPGTFGNEYPAAWCNTFDGGRQWYTALGHYDHSYEDPVFMSHILGGIKWVIANGKPDYSKAYAENIEDWRR